MYPLNLLLIDFLVSAAAQAALDELAGQDLREQASLKLLTRLRRTWQPDQAAALLDQARLRRKAGDKFPHPERLLFTGDALQQASSRAVAVYRAQQFALAFHRSPITDHRSPITDHRSPITDHRSPITDHRSPITDHRLPVTVADLGCGIGADTIALAEIGLSVLAVERDPVRARLAAENVAALGLTAQVKVVCGDWLALTPALSQRERGPASALPLPLGEGWGEGRIHAAFIDPSRRAGEQRIFRLDAMEPPISAVLALLEHVPTLAVKTLPGIADEDIPPNAEVEFISQRGAMKEALLRFGDLRTGAARRATLLPGPHHLDSNASLDQVLAGEPLSYLYEPDAAVIRGTLVRHLATQLGASQLDSTIAYLTSERTLQTPFARGWAVLRHGPFHLKTLNRWLRELEVGAVVVKKRGSAIDPDELRSRLKITPGGQDVTVFLTRVQGRPWMVVGKEEGSRMDTDGTDLKNFWHGSLTGA
jgi:SAM-dependent methyltransferase